MSSISFYIPNPKNEQLINVDYNKLLKLHQEIANFSQGTQGATWSSGVSSEEIYGILREIKKLSEEIEWFPYENENINIMTFIPLEDILNELKSK